MNGQYFGEYANISVNSEPTGEKAPVLATLNYETPVGGTITPVLPQDEIIVQEAPVGQPIVYNQILMGETINHEALVGELVPDIAPEVETSTREARLVSNAEFPASLLIADDSEHLRTRWNDIQGKFVDEPRSTVQQADVLVSEVVEKITQMFADKHSALESQWKQGSDVSTEDLRMALQHYRAFFNRLVV